MTIQTKATAQCFHVVLFTTLYKVALTFKSVDQTQRFFHVVLFTSLYKVVLTFKSVDKTPVCDHSNETH